MVGPYHVLETLETNADGQWLLGYDLRLLRKVWIRTVPPGTPPVPAPLRNIGRVGRLRWLAGRRSPEENWDAFEGVSGQPLLRLIHGPPAVAPGAVLALRSGPGNQRGGKGRHAAPGAGAGPRVDHRRRPGQAVGLSRAGPWRSEGSGPFLQSRRQLPPVLALRRRDGKNATFSRRSRRCRVGRPGGCRGENRGRAGRSAAAARPQLLEDLPQFSHADAVAARIQPLLRRIDLDLALAARPWWSDAWPFPCS